MKDIQVSFGGVGKIYKGGKDCVSYRVNSVDQVLIIISHFDKYPLMTQKLNDYLLFRKAVFMMYNKEHVTSDGLEQIVAIRASLNKGLTDVLFAAFPNITPAPIPELAPSEGVSESQLPGQGAGELARAGNKNKLVKELEFQPATVPEPSDSDCIIKIPGPD